jgi:hypothetical protein
MSLGTGAEYVQVSPEETSEIKPRPREDIAAGISHGNAIVEFFKALSKFVVYFRKANFFAGFGATQGTICKPSQQRCEPSR